MCKNSEIERNDEQPLLERLEAYGRTDVYPFHMPGHKRRLGPKEMGHLYEMDSTTPRSTRTWRRCRASPSSTRSSPLRPRRARSRRCTR